jgi:hypothetical protein
VECECTEDAGACDADADDDGDCPGFQLGETG